MKNIDILYEDNFILVINKPAGLAVQGGEGVKSSLDKILAEDRKMPVFLVHRIDKDTSGLVLTAKTKDAAARFSRLLQDNRTIKQYTAVCSGFPGKDEGVIMYDLCINDVIKKSETRYSVIKKGREPLEYSVLQLELGTGRMHQIRRHLAMIKTPVLGDDKYGDFTLNKSLRKTAGLKRLLLHASRLVLKGEFQLDITSPVPQHFNPFT